MNAFSSSRLAHGEGRIGVIATAQAQRRPDDKKHTAHKNGSSSTGGVKRKRPVSSDALFAEEQSDEEEEEEDAPRVIKGKSAARQPPPPPQPKQRAQQSRRHDDPSSNGGDDDEGEGEEEDDGEGEGGHSSSAPAKKRRTAPEELSSKKAVSAGVIVTALPKFNVEKKRRDPRFDPMCGDFDAVHFHTHYAWMAKEKQEEIARWQSELRSGKVAASGAGGKAARMTDEEREELRSRIQQSQQHLAALKREHSESSIVQKWKSAERKAQKETGKAAFHLKKSEVKKLQLAARYLDLKEKGGLQKFMVKRTKEVANRDHKYMPREGREEKY